MRDDFGLGRLISVVEPITVPRNLPASATLGSRRVGIPNMSTVDIHRKLRDIYEHFLSGKCRRSAGYVFAFFSELNSRIDFCCRQRFLHHELLWSFFLFL
jgi:hypothetical protein